MKGSVEQHARDLFVAQDTDVSNALELTEATSLICSLGDSGAAWKARQKIMLEFTLQKGSVKDKKVVLLSWLWYSIILLSWRGSCVRYREHYVTMRSGARWYRALDRALIVTALEGD